MTDTRLFDKPRALAAAKKLRRLWSLDDALAEFENLQWQSAHNEFPVLHLEDVTGIPFLDNIPGISEYQHRARVRAGTGDLFAAATEPLSGYEDYCRDHLGLGEPEFLQCQADDPRAVARACLTDGAFEKILARAEAAEGLVIHPYMAIESVWELAHALSLSSSATISVLGPPPPALWVANDKSHFSRLVEETLSADWVVETCRSTEPSELAKALAELAVRCEWVGMKRTRCASAMGNVVFDATHLKGQNATSLHALVEEFLTRTQWCDGEEVLVVEWRHTDLSPSTQLWIPAIGEGDPILEGVYEQILDGPEKVFVGSRPSTLPAPLNRALGNASLQVATALQQMGYVGRCSFDFIVTGDPAGEFHAQFTECNGRWGGTSTPMHLVDRLLGLNAKRPPYIATDFFLPESHLGMSFNEFTTALGQELFNPRTGQGRFVLYNVGPLTDRGKFDIISFGSSPEDARRGLDEIIPQLLGFPTA